MTHAIALRPQHRSDPVARVVGPQIHRHRPLQDRPDALAQFPGGGRLAVPDRSQYPDHVGAGDLRYRHPTDARQGVALEAAPPQLGMPGGAPARPQLLPDLPGRLREGGRRLGAALIGQGISPLPGQLPVGEGLLPGFLQRHQGESAEPELGAAATNGEALHPAPAARGPDIEIEALAVAVASGPADVAHKGGHEGVFGMLPARLALRGSFE